MGSSVLFLLVCTGLMHLGCGYSTEQNQTCTTSAQLPSPQCNHSNSTKKFFLCAGVSSSPEADHVLHLKGLISAALDVYTFMRSSMSGVPLIDVSAGVGLDEGHLIRMWLDIRLSPLLSSISRNFLTCLSNRNFSCSAYQTVVRELSLHFSSLDPVRQKWIYSFFMYPFLSRNTTSGCVDPELSSEEWLLKNFGSFSAMAQVRDFTSINMLFSGLEVLHLLSKEQKAELLLHPEVAGLSNNSLSLVFQSLLSSLKPSEKLDTLFYMSSVSSASVQDPLRQSMNSFMTAFRPVGSFVHNFVSLTQQQNLSGMRSATAIQAIINLTLAEIAAPFKENSTGELHVVQDEFDPTNVHDWFTHVVSPILRRFLPNHQTEIPSNLTAVFHNQFFIETGITGAQNESQDVCTVSIDDRTCAVTDLVEHMSKILHCAASSNLTLTEDTLLEVLLHLSQNLNALLQQLSMTNFSGQKPIFGDMLNHIVDDTFTPQSLQDVAFIRLWFHVKMKPLLSTLTPEYLSCLSHKEFSCQTFQQLVSELSDHIFLMSVEGPPNVYNYFILSFLTKMNISGGCNAESSSVWMTQNLGEFSKFSSLMEIYHLNQDFNAIDAFTVLSPHHMAELIVADFPGLPEKHVVIDLVFNFMLVSSEERGLLEMLEHLIVVSEEKPLQCPSYQQIVQRLKEVFLPPYMMKSIQEAIEHMTKLAPPGCFSPTFKCISTPVNETSLCFGVNSSELDDVMSYFIMMSISCDITVEQYACSLLGSFSAENLADLLMCQLSSNISTSSKEIWKLLFTKTNDSLDQALIIFSRRTEHLSQPIKSESLSLVLDVIGEVILERLSDDQWSDVGFISVMFGQNLKFFLPHASSTLLQCISSKNLSCQTFQHLVNEFNLQFHLMSETQRRIVVDIFVLPFLRRNTTDGGCLFTSNNSTEWILMNFGQFVELVSLRDLLFINPHFDPLETLVYLSPAQKVALMLEDLPGLPEKHVIINEVFDHLLESPVERHLPDVLQLLFVSSKANPLSCTSNQIIFGKLKQTLRTSVEDFESIIWMSLYNLNSTAPAGCSLLPDLDECPLIPFNEAQLCSGVDSSLLQLHLNNSENSWTFCDFSVQQYACTPMRNISVENLVSVLECQSSADVVSSPESWKLFLIRVLHIMDSALHSYSNTSLWWSSQSGSHVLDVVRELRLDRLTDDAVLATWFGEYLKPFLPFASRTFLQCLSVKNFSCQNFQRVVAVLDAGFVHMSDFQKEMTVTEFILPIIQRQTAESSCVSDDSAVWLSMNLAQFSSLLTLDQLINLNPQLKLMETLVYLSPVQLVALMVNDVPGLPDKEAVINDVFDHLRVSPKKIPDFLHNLLLMSEMSNMSCVSYRAIFHRLDHLLIGVSVNLETDILRSRTALLKSLPQGCLSYSGVCDITPLNETAVCKSVNSSALSVYLSSAPDSSQLCDYSITQYSCAELTDLSSQDLETVLSCGLHSNESVSDETWKLFVKKVNPVLGPALDQLSNTGLNKSRLSVSLLNVIGEVTLSTFSSSSLTDDSFVQRWFNGRLRPFLPHSSEAFLSCLTTRDFNCDTFRTVVESFSQSFDLMSADTQENVYVDFIKVFLSLNKSEGCVAGTKNSSDWLIRNFGYFNIFSTINDLQMLNPTFSVMETLSLMTIRQLVEVSSTPGLLSTSTDVNTLLSNIPTAQLTGFYTTLSTSLQVGGVSLSPVVREEFLLQVFVRVNLTSASDADLLLWIQNILPPFIANISVQHVTTYFNILQGRPCSINQQGVQLLNSSRSSFTPATQDEIYNQILHSLQGPAALRCYGNQSYLSFLQSSFMSFQFPNLSTFLSLMPPAHVPELMFSMSPAEISSVLNRPNAVDDVTKVCKLLSIYPKTPQYLQTEPVGSEALARQVLSCIWSQVLRVENRSEVDQWFDHRLVNYLPLLTAQLITPDVMRNASCYSFSKFVFVMSKYTYNIVEFSQRDIYKNIQIYLNTSSTPKCYDPSHPELNSTAWFSNYINTFMSFITLDDLTLLYGSSKLQPFTVNLDNLKLFDSLIVPDNVTDFYITLLFQENPNFNAYYLPVKFRCLAPASSFTSLSVEQLKIVSPSIHQNCTNIQPDVSAALATNAQELTMESITVLGQSCVGLSTAQLSGAGGQVLLTSLPVLSSVIGWNQDQTMTIIKTLLSSGLYTINSSSSLQAIGSLITGVSSSMITSISGNELLTSFQSVSFLTHVTSAPIVLQQTIVNQMITVNSSSDVIIKNVPDVMATEIPRIHLIDLSPAVAQTINMKKWKHEQAVLLFELVAGKINDADTISFQVLQGFTCSRLQSFSKLQINNLIRGCRQRGNDTVNLQESQLTCMYQFIKNSNPGAFTDYPADVLLYYDYSLVQSSRCQSFFTALGKANFSVLSNTLSFKKQTLFSNARSCLGISGLSISREQLDVLGSMCCILSADYILNSDPYVLEKLKECRDLTDQQISAVETLLLTGKTPYGPSDSWNRMTLENLGILTLHVTTNIWSKFTKADKLKFQKTFIRGLRKKDRDLENNLLKMTKELTKSSRITRATECTVGQITQVVVYSDMFPFDYDVTQFDVCLSLQTLKDNLEAITDKVYDPDLQRVILNKLNQVYPGGLSDEQLQVLGSTSRVATPNDVTRWSVTNIDTLSSLMDSRNGEWDPEMVQLIVARYLGVSGNKLGSQELNSLGSNICALNTSVLNNIPAASIEKAMALPLSNCSSEQKRIVFSVALEAFSTTNKRVADTVSLTTYQLLQTYLGGADITYVRKLVNSNVNMDLITFMSLEQSIINVLNVTDVKSLLGMNVEDLKTYESASQIQHWIKLQLQSDLDTLKVGLTGGRNFTVTTAIPSVSNSTTYAPGGQNVTITTTGGNTVTSSTTTGGNTVTSSTTKGAASRVYVPVCLQIFLLTVTMATVQLLH